MSVVRLNRDLGLRTALSTLLLLWPLFLFGQPAYFADSLSYYKGGQVAVAYAVAKIAPADTPDGARGSPTRIPDTSAAAAGDAKGARSVVYSVAAYVLRAPGAHMALLAVAQAMGTALLLAAVTILLGVRGRNFAVIAVIMAAATPIACFVNLIIPDIFAGLLIAILVMFAAAGEHLSLGLRLVLLAIASFAVTAHASHPPLAAGLCLLGSAWLWFGRDAQRRLIPWLVAPLALGVAATVATGFIGFGTVSIAAKRFPLSLARSIEDGPARWYLKENCAKRHYAVCEVLGSTMPSNVPDFLWGPDGLTENATTEQMDRIRAEEQEIVLAAAQAYPDVQAKKTIGNIVSQLARFGLTETRFDMRIERDAKGTPHLVPSGQNHDALLAVVQWLSIVSVSVAAAWLAWRFRSFGKDDRAIVLLMIAGLFGNALICAIFSGVAERYQARVIWLLPLLALALALRPRIAPVQSER